MNDLTQQAMVPTPKQMLRVLNERISQESLSELIEAKGVVCPQSQVSRICNGQQPFPALYEAIKSVFEERAVE